MISSRRFRFSMTCLSLFGSAALFLAVTSCSSSVAPSSVRAEDKKKDAEKKEAAAETDPDFAVPDGTPEEINEFIEKLRAKRPKFANRQEFVAYAIKTQQTCITAADKIMAQETSDKVAAAAAEMKMGALTMLAANGIEDYPQKALDVATKLKTDKRTAVAKVANKYWSDIRIFNASKMSDEERKALIEELIAAVRETKFSREALGSANRLANTLADQGKSEEAGALYEQLAKVSSESDDEKLRKNAPRFEGMARRMRLPGHFMALEGKVLSGGELDWASYRGKVVLVDFWATWCGPCVAELPNVKANYKKYHDKGFDVIGISLDQARDQLDKFIEKEEIPWTQMYDEFIQKNEGWNHPMAQMYGINAIPAAILVDKEGNVVSMAARGEELPKLLEKLLGKAE